MKVLVCGGRDYADYAHVKAVLDEIHAKTPLSCVIHGAARGADFLADRWSNERGMDTRVFPANWRAYGPAAGPRRNETMLKEGKPDLVVAFPGGRGTADMVRRAIAANVTVIYG